MRVQIIVFTVPVSALKLLHVSCGAHVTVDADMKPSGRCSPSDVFALELDVVARCRPLYCRGCRVVCGGGMKSM